MTRNRRGLRRRPTTPPPAAVVNGWEDDALPGDPPPDSEAGRILAGLRVRPGVYGRVATYVNPITWCFSENALALDWLKRHRGVVWETRHASYLRVDVWAKVETEGERLARDRSEVAP